MVLVISTWTLEGLQMLVFYGPQWVKSHLDIAVSIFVYWVALVHTAIILPQRLVFVGAKASCQFLPGMFVLG